MREPWWCCDTIPVDCFGPLRDLLSCPYDIIWWPIIYAIIAVIGTFILLFFISMNSPPGIPPSLACLCPVKDYAIMSATNELDENNLFGPVVDGSLVILNYVGSTRPVSRVNFSTTSSSSKFAFVGLFPVLPPPPEVLVYTPVFTGNSPVSISGAFSAALSFAMFTTPAFTLQFLISWSNDNNVTWNTITESRYKFSPGATQPNRTTFSLPYAVSFTKAQMSSAGNVHLSVGMILTQTNGDIRYGVYDITISATEV